MEDLCDNIGLVLVCLPSGSTDVAASPSQYMIQPSGIPILSPVLFMHVGDPYILIFDLLVSPPFLVSFRQFNYYPKPALLSLLHTYFSITMRFVTKKIIWPVLSMYIHAFIATY